MSPMLHDFILIVVIPSIAILILFVIAYRGVARKESK